jgi:glucose-1-phosphate thymidylyltransferase
MRAIIPVAGIGSRLRPHTHTQPKSLIPVAGEPILAHIIRPLIAVGVTEYTFIIGYLGDKIEEYITSKFPDIKANYVIQTTGKGIGHALWLAKEYIKEDEETIIVLGDTIADINYQELLSMKGTVLACKRVEDPRSFGVAEVNDKGIISVLVEKPSIPKSNMALVGIYKISESKKLIESLNYIIEHKIKTRNEYYLTDALMHMISLGVEMKLLPVDHWFDCGKPSVLLETNSTLLRRNNPPYENNFENTIIIPPVYIAKTAQIKNSIIGPEVSIGEEAIINFSIIKNSIIGPSAHLENAILHHSLIGNDATFQGMQQSLNIGDSTEINFG